MVKRMRYLAVVVAAWALWSAAPAEVGDKTPASSPAPGVVALRAKAFQLLLEGQFRKGLDLLETPAGKKAGKPAAEARGITAEYLELRAERDAARKADLSTAEMRVRLARLALKHQAKLKADELDEKKLYDGIGDIADAVHAATDAVEVIPSAGADEMRERARKEIAKAGEKLGAVRELVGNGDSEWGKAFTAAAEDLKRSLAASRQVWAKAKLPDDWRKLTLASEKVEDALIDLGVLAARDPLMVALNHAREGRELADDAAGFLAQDWVRQLIQEADQHGKEFIESGEWSEALSVYGSAGLTGLNEDNEGFKSTLKRVGQHVRIISLYGQHGKPSTRPAGGDEPDDEPRWREMIVGIDTAMVRNAVNQIDNSYVRRPDYRALTIAGLQGLKVLAETPQASAALTALKDEPKRKAFVAGLSKQVQRLRDAATVDHLDVQTTLNTILDLNYDTVGLPAEVVDLEFAEAMLPVLDKFTAMIWPYEVADFNKRTMGSFYGIGVQIRKDIGQPIEIVTPLADTPAYRAGIRAGDFILKVDGRETKDISISRAVKRITGPKLTKVTLTIRRAGTTKPFDVDIVRNRIQIKTVKGWRRLPDGRWDYLVDRENKVGYVRLTQFTADSAADLRNALRELRRADVRGVILDMRFNPGGLLTSSVDVANEFLSRGLIVRTKGLNVPDSERKASGVGEYRHGLVVVLVNQYSASAAEIASGALKDWGRATIVGVRSYGKGSVQRLIPLQLNRKAKLKLTTAYYYLPSGRCLHRTNGAKLWGVDPHIPVPVTIRQMNRWLEVRRETDLLKSVEPELQASLLGKQLREDIQLQTAVLLIRLKLLARGG